METVRKDPEIGSATALNDAGLIDHLPKLFDDLVDALNGRPADGRLAAHAELHGQQRWEQHYNLTEVLGEMGILCRLIFSCGLDAFEGASREELGVARERVLRFFEDASAGSVRAFATRQLDQINTLNGRLREADRSLAAAAQSERDRLAYVFKHSPSFMAILGGPEHVFEVVNDRYHDLVGRRDVLHKPVREALPEVADQGFFELLDRVYANGEPVIGNDVRLLLRDEAGQPREYFLDFVYLPIRADDGTITGVFAHGVDLTARKNTEKAFVALAEQRRLALDAARMGWWHLDIPSGKVSCDERFEKIYGVAEGEFPYDKGISLIHPEDRKRVDAAVRAATRSRDPAPYSVEARVVHPDGSIHWVQSMGQATFEGEGEQRRAVSFSGTLTEITEAKTVRDALREREARFRQLADAMPQIVFAGGPDGHIDYYNGQWYDYTGLPPGTVGTAAWNDLLHPDDYRKTMEVWSAALRSGELYEMEYRLKRASDGSYRWFLGRALPVKNAAGGVLRWFGTSTDIHEFKQLQEQNVRLLDSERAARTEAERTNRLKDEFLATLSHELRTPLNAILGWAQVLRDGHADAADLAQGLTTIERNARAQNQIIEDLLDMSRIISGKVRLDVQPLDLDQVIKSAVDTMRPAAEARSIRLQTMLDPDARMISGDPNRLQQVFWNLLSNAIKFTPGGGRVQVLLERADSHVEVSVTDSGEGIAPEFLPHVFDRFRQQDASTTRRHGGLGLGLAIVKQLVELHGGAVRAESKGLGFGATFRVSLPLSVVRSNGDRPSGERIHPAAWSHGAARPPANSLSLAGVRVLVVDDEVDARLLVKRLLEDRGAKVFTAGSAAEALRLIATEPSDVLVSDIGMPGVDGYELIRQVRALPPEQGGNVPAVALTAYARSEDRLKIILAGFQMHMAKPVEAAELLTLVASLAERTCEA